VFSSLGRHRRLFRWWLPFAATLLLRGRLPRRDVEVLILRSAVNSSSPYEWAQHVPFARAAGLELGEVAAIADPAAGAALSERQHLLIEAADQLHSQKVLSDSTWARLAVQFEEDQLIELCMVVGHYEMLAMTLNSIGVQPEPSALAQLDEKSRQTAELLEERSRRAGQASRATATTPTRTL